MSRSSASHSTAPHPVFVVEFQPAGSRVEVPQGVSILQSARKAGVPLRADCGGKGTCGKCHVFYEPGRSEKHVPADPGRMRSAERRRGLACRTFVTKNLLVYVPPQSSEDTEISVLTDTPSLAETEHPVAPTAESRLTIIPLALPPPSREDARADRLRLMETLAQTEFPSDFPRTEILASLDRSFEAEHFDTLSEKLRRFDWKGRLVLLDGRFVDFLAPEATCDARASSQWYAVAFDLGTTTLVAEMVPITPFVATQTGYGERRRADADPDAARFFRNDLPRETERRFTARKNPQNRYGADVISRIETTRRTPDALREMRACVLEAFREMLEELADQADVSPERIVLVTLAGNTVMQQIFFGIAPGPLGVSPFVPATDRYPVVRAKTLDLPIHPEGLVLTFPILGGFVGGDLTSGILATQLDLPVTRQGAVVLIDIGTNGEMILVHEDVIYAAATAAGPAFEGASITCGMIAAPGAIDSVTFHAPHIDVHTIGNLPPRGICGSALIDLVAELLRSGLIDSTGMLRTEGPFCDAFRERLVRFDGQAAFLVSDAAEDSRPVVLTQKDIRQLQLASGAIRCGVRLLLKAAGLSLDRIASLYLAGGFGNDITPGNAKRIGLFPREIALDAIRSCGNTSLAGARLLARDATTDARIHRVLRRTVHIDLSTCEDFSRLFAESMIFPETE